MYMTERVTLNLDTSVVEFAHEFSERHNKSISRIIEDYFIMLKETQSAEPSVDIGDLYGIFEGMDAPDKKVLRAAFHEKHRN